MLARIGCHASYSFKRPFQKFRVESALNPLVALWVKGRIDSEGRTERRGLGHWACPALPDSTSKTTNLKPEVAWKVPPPQPPPPNSKVDLAGDILGFSLWKTCKEGPGIAFLMPSMPFKVISFRMFDSIVLRPRQIQ